MDSLTVNEYADLKGCTVRYVQKLISDNKLQATESFGAGGKCGLSYLIPLSSIEPELQEKYQRRLARQHSKEMKETAAPESPNMELYTEEERAEIALWKQILAEWNVFRNEYRDRNGNRNMAEADGIHVRALMERYPDMKFSRRILQRKDQYLRERGEGALADRRGKHDNHGRVIDDYVFGIFENFYLDQSRKSVRKCMELTELQLKRRGMEDLLPLASETTFAREIERRIKVPVLKYCRFGDKAMRDECAPHIMRSYRDLNSNDIWVCDNHTFDVFIHEEGVKKPARVYLTGFLDVRSRKMVGWYVTTTPSSDATLAALRRGIERYGIPKVIYSDNGREFLTHDIAGRGFPRPAKTDGHEPPTILQNLGIEFRTAMVRNARAKIIERAFLDVKNDFSKLFEGYTGGTILERPERLKKTGKDAENFIMRDEFTKYVDIFIQGYFNKRSHFGEGMDGKTRDDVYAECLVEKRTATTDELNLMMLRNSRPVKVNRNGLKLSINGKDLYFISAELLYHHFGEQVYYRYNPDDLKEVRVYDESDRFIGTAQQIATLSYFATKEEVQREMQKLRSFEKMVKAYKKNSGIETDSELTLIMEEAARKMALGEDIDPKVIVPIRSSEQPALAEAVGNSERIDYTEALERLRKAKERTE